MKEQEINQESQEDTIKNENQTTEEVEVEAVAAEEVATEEVPVVETVEDQLAKALEEIAKLKEKALYQKAEFENYRKRTAMEKADLIKNGGKKVISTILPVIDDMELAQKNMEKAQDVAAVKEGVNLIIDKFLSLLKREGLEQIDAVGKPFDVDFHEAIAMVPGQPDEMKGKVIDCIQTGYTLNGDVIRHSKVAVAQ